MRKSKFAPKEKSWLLVFRAKPRPATARPYKGSFTWKGAETNRSKTPSNPPKNSLTSDCFQTFCKSESGDTLRVFCKTLFSRNILFLCLIGRLRWEKDLLPVDTAVVDKERGWERVECFLSQYWICFFFFLELWTLELSFSRSHRAKWITVDP